MKMDRQEQIDKWSKFYGRQIIEEKYRSVTILVSSI